LPEKKPNSVYEREESVGDEEYEAAFRRIIMPILKQYAPDAILVSCGFDSGDGDTIGSLKVSKVGYRTMTSQLRSLGKPILAVLEGGYSEEVLGWGSKAVVDGLTEESEKPNEPIISPKANKIGEEGISRCLEEVGKLWNLH
jgi:histone deacetylase 6